MNGGAPHALHRSAVPYPDFGAPTLVAGPVYNVVAGDSVLLVSTAGGNVTVNLLAAATRLAWVLTVKKNTADANDVIVLPHAGDTIDLQASQQLMGLVLSSLMLYSDGVHNWVVIA